MDSASSEQDEVKSVSRLCSPDRAYDANGNTLSDASGKSYTWDFENRLMQAVVPGTNGGTTTFKYDPFGRRIYKQSPNFTGVFLYDGLNLIQTMSSSGSEIATYTQTQRIDETLAELRSSTTGYYQVDGLGSITSLSGTSGALANTYAYDSFGDLTVSTGTMGNYLQYTGREFDTETGLYFNRARYYEPSGGRFLSEDPIRFKGGVDFYVYVHSNPILLRDPMGLCPDPVQPSPPLGMQCPCQLEAGLIRGIACTYGCTCPDGSQHITIVKCSLADPYAGKLCPATYTITVRAGSPVNADRPAPGFCGPVKPN